MILGGDALDRLRRSHVAVFGLGGVGSYVVEALCRAGVGELTLIDGDTVSVTNINRQLYALHSTVGQPKAEAAAARCRDICPDTVVHPIVGIYDAALGTGNKLQPELLTITDIAKTSGCPLARVMRKELRGRGIHHLKVAFSPEQPGQTQQLETPPPGRRSVPASVSWVPPVAGLLMAGTVVQDLLNGGGLIP